MNNHNLGEERSDSARSPYFVSTTHGSGGGGGSVDGWCTDGQGNSWGHFLEQAWFDRIPKWVIFLMGLQIGALLSAVLCYVSW